MSEVPAAAGAQKDLAAAGASFEPLLYSSTAANVWDNNRIEKSGSFRVGEQRMQGRSRRHSAFTQTFREFAEHSSLHGLWQATNPSFHICRRLLWLAAVCTGTSVLLYAFIQQLRFFLQFRVDTVITVQEQDYLKFPALTICNHNQFRKSLVIKANGLSEVLRELFSVQSYVESIKEASGLQSDNLTSEDWNLTQKLIELAHQLETMVFDCRWGGLFISCKDYFTLTITELGVCYTFNSLEIQRKYGELFVHSAGSDGGLLLRVNIENDEYYYGEGESAGIQVLVHEPLQVPLVRQHGFAVAPGTTTVGAIQTYKNILAKHPYGDCVDPTEQSSVTSLQYYDVYTPAACKVEQRIKYVYGVCQCKMYYEPGNLTVCKTTDDVRCAQRARTNYTLVGVKELNKHCPPSCESDDYDVRLSYAAFPAQHIVEEMVESYNMTEDAIRKNILQLKVFFEDLSIRRTEQKPAYTGAALFADVGGQMGLCIGASLLTLIELVEFASLVIVRMIRW